MIHRTHTLHKPNSLIRTELLLGFQPGAYPVPTFSVFSHFDHRLSSVKHNFLPKKVRMIVADQSTNSQQVN